MGNGGWGWGRGTLNVILGVGWELGVYGREGAVKGTRDGLLLGNSLSFNFSVVALLPFLNNNFLFLNYIWCTALDKF